MADDQPRDALGNPLRMGAGAAGRPQGAVDRWQEWSAWGESAEARIRAVVAQAAAADDRTSHLIKNTLEAVRNLVARIVEERQARERLAAELQAERERLTNVANAADAELERLRARIAALETTGGTHSAPALSAEETELMRQRCRAALAATVSEVATNRRAAKRLPPPRPNGSHQ